HRHIQGVRTQTGVEDEDGRLEPLVRGARVGVPVIVHHPAPRIGAGQRHEAEGVQGGAPQEGVDADPRLLAGGGARAAQSGHAAAPAEHQTGGDQGDRCAAYQHHRDFSIRPWPAPDAPTGTPVRPRGSEPKRGSIARRKGAMTRRSRLAADATDRIRGGFSTGAAILRDACATAAARVAGNLTRAPPFLDRADRRCLLAGRGRAGSPSGRKGQDMRTGAVIAGVIAATALAAGAGAAAAQTTPRGSALAVSLTEAQAARATAAGQTRLRFTERGRWGLDL